MALFEHSSKMKKGDVFLFYYSGHGCSNPDVLLPFNPPEVKNDEASVITRDDIQSWIEKFLEKGVYVLMILDSCHGGGLVRSLESSDKLVCLTSCHAFDISAGIPVSETESIGLMTKCLLDIIQEDQNQNMTFRQVYDQMYINMENRKEEWFEKIDKIKNERYDILQDPVITGPIDRFDFWFNEREHIRPYIQCKLGKTSLKGTTAQFKCLSILPYITKGSKYAAYDTFSADISKSTNNAPYLFEVVKVNDPSSADGNRASFITATVKMLKGGGSPFRSKSLNAVQIKHTMPEGSKYYTKVFIDPNCGEDVKDILKNFTEKIDRNRSKFPASLPRSSFIHVLDSKDDADIYLSTVRRSEGRKYIEVAIDGNRLVLPPVPIVENSNSSELIASHVTTYAHRRMISQLQNDTSQLQSQFSFTTTKTTDNTYILKVTLEKKIEFILCFVRIHADHTVTFIQEKVVVPDEERKEKISWPYIFEVELDTPDDCSPTVEIKTFLFEVETVQQKNDGSTAAELINALGNYVGYGRIDAMKFRYNGLIYSFYYEEESKRSSLTSEPKYYLRMKVVDWHCKSYFDCETKINYV
mmetsp:Transcript_1546/g.1904  ORF Transcript_1546/g.1904 Transcript_1546/m.1904 type:complete len:584 (-) Transcript_1546:92-1843(-)